MKVLILGATGGTGLHLVSEALDRGHDVIALARNPGKIQVTNERLKVVDGDILSVDTLLPLMTGCDAVLSAVGGRPGMFTPCDVYLESARATVEALRKSGVKRYVIVTAWGTKDDPGLPFVWRWVMKPTLMRNIVGDMEKMEEFLLTDCKDINYTVIRPPRLTNMPSNGGQLLVSEGQCVAGEARATVTRQDLARFMLDCLTQDTHSRKMVAVRGPPQ